jgi:hypothetical protein
MITKLSNAIKTLSTMWSNADLHDNTGYVMPERIWVQPPKDVSGDLFGDGGISWTAESLGENDVEYVRLDVASSIQKNSSIQT